MNEQSSEVEFTQERAHTWERFHAVLSAFVSDTNKLLCNPVIAPHPRSRNRILDVVFTQHDLGLLNITLSGEIASF